MNPAQKYMSQVNLDNTDIKFAPFTFINKNLRDDFTSNVNKNLRDDFTNNVNNNLNLDLFPSETGLPQLCYYSSESYDFANRNVNTNANMNIDSDIIPTTFDALRGFDLDLDETEDLERVHSDNNVNKIYSKIERNHPGIFATLYSYRIPSPIARVIVKRLIRLTLSYCDREKNH